MSHAEKSSGGNISVREIDLRSKAEVRRFIEFPFALYRDVPQWTPPVWLEMEELMDPRKNGFFEHSAAAFFLAESGGQVVGRVAAMWNRFYNEKHHNDTAFFYWFEAINDERVAAALLSSAESWARERGLRRMLGPIGFIQPDPPGILVHGFEHEGTMNVPWHFPYYEQLVMRAGFTAHMDYLSGYLDRNLPVPPELLTHGAAALKRGGYTVQSFSKRAELERWVERFFGTYLNAFTDVPDFFGMSGRQFDALVKGMMIVIDPATTKLLIRDEEMIGFLLSFRDVTPGLRRSRGKLLPLGWWHLLRSRAANHQCNIIALGVLPERQKGGANLALIAEFVKTMTASPFGRAEIVQIVGGNMNTHGDMTRLGAKWDKTHRVFRKQLGATAASPAIVGGGST